jgi:hypothetical protein
MGSEFMSFVSLLLDGCQRKNRMGVMKSMWVVFCLLMVSGCETLNVVNNIKYNHKIVEESMQEEPKKASEINVEENIVQQYIPTLYDLTNSSNEIRPEELMIYRHTVGRIMVFQSIKEKGKDEGDSDVTWVLASGKNRGFVHKCGSLKA